MTATPHSGHNASLWGLLRLLDLDAYGDRCPREIKVPQQQFRKVSKEIMRDMYGEKLFKARHPKRVEYDLTPSEQQLYDAVTDFVANKLRAIRGEQSRTTASFALTTMQRRAASSTRAIRRTLERRVARIDKALEDPAAYLRNRRDFQDVTGRRHRRPGRPRRGRAAGGLRSRRWRSGCRTPSPSWKRSGCCCCRCSPWPRRSRAGATSGS